MNDSPRLAWEPRAIWEIHRIIERCSAVDLPNILISSGDGGRDSRNARSAVLSASFNPPTVAHAALVRWALASERFHRVLILLDIHHADKVIGDAVLEDRAIMMKICYGRDSRLALGVSSHGRFVDKLEALASRNPASHTWTFLVGLDNFARILDPRFYEAADLELPDLFERAHFVVFTRSRVSQTVRLQLRAWIHRGARLQLVPAPLEARGTSSTLVRTERARGRPISSWVAPEVEAFIEDTGLYLPSPPHPPLYAARKRVLERLFQQGPRAYQGVDLRREALRICQEMQRGPAEGPTGSSPGH